MRILLSQEKINNLLRVLKDSNPTSAIAEVGVFEGGSLIEMARSCPHLPVFGYDTFEGLPGTFDSIHEYHWPSEFKSDFLEVEKSCYPYKNIALVKGLFPESGVDCSYSFVHLDMDQANGTLAAIDFFWPRLTPGGVIFFDDYGWKNCPGIKPLVDGLFRDVKIAGTYQAYVVKNG